MRVLVTGAAGFIGSWIVRTLCERGHQVRAAVRDPRARAKTKHLDALGAEIVGAELTVAGSVDAHLSGVDAVIHSASPVILSAKDPEREIVGVAVAATENVLRAAARHGVGRVVMTSSESAIVDGARPRGSRFSESDWNESATLRTDPYALSKLRAERAAIAVRDALPEGERFTLVALHPSTVLGPILAPDHVRTSVDIVRSLMRGDFPGVPNLFFDVVDVRDVAEAHARAMEAREPASRYICAHQVVGLRTIAQALREAHPEERTAKRNLPDIAMYLAAVVDPRITLSFLRHSLGTAPRLDHGKIERELGQSFRPWRETLLECARSLVEAGLTRRR
jgi:nucleoside-diphosphate-sugar epimerase